MAKKKTNSGKLFNFVSQMAGGFITPQKTIGKITLDTDGETSMSPSERNRLIERIAQSAGPTIPRGGKDSYGKYIRPLTQQIAQTKLDNEAMRLLAPEIKTAENIVIPSIMSPTDMKDNEIKITSESTLVTPDQNNRISELLDKHFNKTMKMSTKIPEWIREALYGAGSKPLLVLPITELDIIMNDPTAIASVTTTSSYSSESLKNAREAITETNKLDLISIFGIADSHFKKSSNSNKNSLDLTPLRPAIESLIVDFVDEIGGISKDKVSTSYNLNTQFKKDIGYTELNAFAAEAIESLNIVDNPDVLKVDKAKKAKKKSDITQNIVVHYKTKMLITVNPEVKESVGNPVFYELPPESVIPLFTPGSPTDHIGYFVAIDEFGNPIHLDDNDQNKNLGDNRRTSPGALYKSFGLDSQFHLGNQSPKSERNALMVGIYQTIIEAHLKNRLKDSGLDNMYIGATENVYRCMFARYLSERRTKLLFIPKDFMTYFCFKHNSDGTGRSQIEDIKFILSLKITLMICRMMASMNSAINRKKINAKFTEEMGDPVQYIEMLKKEAIDKSVVNFTYDPSEITRTLAQRSLIVNATGIPGLENFEISTEPNEYRNISPDESLMEDVKQLMIFGLDIPPSAMNLLSENEFSRSVATNNLFFSRKISAKQKLTCEAVARHVKIYTSLSKYLKDEIKDILKQGDKDSKDDKGTIDDDTSINELMNDIINNITTSLPAPDVAPNKTEFEELDAMIGSITTALEAIFDNDLASDDPIPALRALVKSSMIREYMAKIGVSNDANIAELNHDLLGKLTDFRHKLVNTKKAMSDISSKTTMVPLIDEGNQFTGNTDTNTDGGVGGGPPSF